MAQEVAELQTRIQAITEENNALKAVVSRLKKELEEKEAELQVSRPPEAEVSSPKPPLLWKGCPRLPCGIVRPHVVVKDKCVYVGGGNATKIENSRTVFKFDTTNWSRLSITPYYMFSLAVVKGLVTVIGGIAVLSASATNALASYDDKSKKWCHTLPTMPSKRCATSATTTENHLVVVGGIGQNSRNYLRTVEILNLSSRVWSVVDSVPRPVTFMSIVSCPVRNRIYLLGGLTGDGAIRAVLSCFVPDLVDSGPNGTRKGVWEDITEAPYFRSGGAAINGKLVTASGLSEDDNTTTTMFAFDPVSKTWEAVGEMAAARSSCSIAVLSESEVMVVGGYVDPRSWQMSLTTDVMQTVNLRVPQ